MQGSILECVQCPYNLSFVRVYYDAGLNESYTNPGEWPWVVLIYYKEKYIGYKYKAVDFSYNKSFKNFRGWSYVGQHCYSNYR